MDRFAACFADLKVPCEDNARHLLLDLLVIGFCTILCDGEDCSDMALFGRAKEGFLRQFLRLPPGISSHDTFNRVFRLLPRRGSRPVSCASWPASPRSPMGAS
jgi:hypothetical protein